MKQVAATNKPKKQRKGRIMMHTRNTIRSEVPKTELGHKKKIQFLRRRLTPPNVPLLSTSSSSQAPLPFSSLPSFALVGPS